MSIRKAIIADLDAMVDIEVRMSDIKRRYGRYPQRKWDKNLELKRYFEEKADVHSIYEVIMGDKHAD